LPIIAATASTKRHTAKPPKEPTAKVTNKTYPQAALALSTSTESATHAKARKDATAMPNRQMAKNEFLA